MKLNKFKISLILLLIILLGSISVLSYGAASFSITSGISTIKQGSSYTITITAKGLTGRFNISHSSNVSVNVSSVWVENGVADSTIKVTTKSEGKATVTITPDSVADASTGELVSLSAKTDTVTVKPKQTNSDSNTTDESSSSGKSEQTTTKLTFTSKNEKVYSTTNDLIVRSNHSRSSSSLGILNEGDSVTRIGIATKSSDGILWSKVTYNGRTGYIASAYLTTTKPEVKDVEDDIVSTNDNDEKDDEKDNKKSNNVNLKTLEVTPTGLSPAFSEGNTEYTMTVGSDIENIEIKAVAQDKNAEVVISGNENLKVGDNKVTIVVTAEDESSKTYTITVKKEEEELLRLEELLVEGLPLKPEFNSNIFEYTLTLDKNDVSELNITATPDKKDAEIEIVGNTDLKQGENIITVLVKSIDGEEITTYQITVNVPVVAEIVPKTNDNMYKYMGIGIAVLILIILVIGIIKRNSNKDDEFDSDYGEINKDEIKEFSNENIDLENLPKLNDNELPKYLRKEGKCISEETKEDLSENKEEIEEKSERSKKIDELYAMSSDSDVKKKRGKHF